MILLIPIFAWKPNWLSAFQITMKLHCYGFMKCIWWSYKYSATLILWFFTFQCWKNSRAYIFDIFNQDHVKFIETISTKRLNVDTFGALRVQWGDRCRQWKWVKLVEKNMSHRFFEMTIPCKDYWKKKSSHNLSFRAPIALYKVQKHSWSNCQDTIAYLYLSMQKSLKSANFTILVFLWMSRTAQ